MQNFIRYPDVILNLKLKNFYMQLGVRVHIWFLNIWDILNGVDSYEGDTVMKKNYEIFDEKR
jgi:hypothetical protein